MLNDTKTRKDRMTRPRPEKMVRVEVYLLPSMYNKIVRKADGRMTASQWIRSQLEKVIK